MLYVKNNIVSLEKNKHIIINLQYDVIFFSFKEYCYKRVPYFKLF